jgi:hypothetical protein
VSNSLSPSLEPVGKNRNSFENIACRSAWAAEETAEQEEIERITSRLSADIAAFRYVALMLFN